MPSARHLGCREAPRRPLSAKPRRPNGCEPVDSSRAEPMVCMTLRWSGMDSNFQYAGAVNLVCCPYAVGCLGRRRPERQQGFAPDCPGGRRIRTPEPALAGVACGCEAVEIEASIGNRTRAVNKPSVGRLWLSGLCFARQATPRSRRERSAPRTRANSLLRSCCEFVEQRLCFF